MHNPHPLDTLGELMMYLGQVYPPGSVLQNPHTLVAAMAAEILNTRSENTLGTKYLQYQAAWALIQE